MTLADALSDYARECQHDRLRSFLRFNVLNSTNDNPTAPSPPSLSGATGGGSVFNNAAPNPINDARGDDAERFCSVSPFHGDENAR